MDIEKTSFEGVYVWRLRRYADTRGYFCELFRNSVLNGTSMHDFCIRQVNQSHSKKGVFRGFHLQRPPHAQAKIIHVLKGSIYDFALDLRQQSSTYRQTYVKRLSERDPELFFIPKGFAHGFLVESEIALVQYFVDNLYMPSAEISVNCEDTALNVQWPVKPPFMRSDKDKAAGPLAKADKWF